MDNENADAVQGDTAAAEGSAAEGSLISEADGKGAEATEDGSLFSKAGKEGQEGEDAEAKQDETPVEYQDFELAEGMIVQDEIVADLKGLAGEFKLSQEQAQKLVDLHCKAVQNQFATFEAETVRWAEETKNDPDVGGVKLKETMAMVAAARDRFGSPELTKLLDDTRLGNKVELVKFFRAVGKAISEDSFVSNEANMGRPKSTEEIFYDKTK